MTTSPSLSYFTLKCLDAKYKRPASRSTANVLDGELHELKDLQGVPSEDLQLWVQQLLHSWTELHLQVKLTMRTKAFGSREPSLF